MPVYLPYGQLCRQWKGGQPFSHQVVPAQALVPTPTSMPALTVVVEVSSLALALLRRPGP
ncbi:hypothetical protein MU249_004410 [Salmonella enterica]|nr:hypothetical protein [Salmonella enterica subsp. enterica serovar Java]EDJ5029816.1 hypothetical protein [Salmonella enterica]EGL0768355.1 hypothetical protein [Salmonella enterica subsp. enterica]HCM8912625.1 hypothetical protein [Salmonella enterica subsp. enterica serovar Paratyphi B]EEC5202873.1 hypothetical protein [Salmonella enterica]